MRLVGEKTVYRVASNLVSKNVNKVSSKAQNGMYIDTSIIISSKT